MLIVYCFSNCRGPVFAGLPRSEIKVWKMIKNPNQGKISEFHYQFKKIYKCREFKRFPK